MQHETVYMGGSKADISLLYGGLQIRPGIQGPLEPWAVKALRAIFSKIGENLEHFNVKKLYPYYLSFMNSSLHIWNCQTCPITYMCNWHSKTNIEYKTAIFHEYIGWRCKGKMVPSKRLSAVQNKVWVIDIHLLATLVYVLTMLDHR